MVSGHGKPSGQQRPVAASQGNKVTSVAKPLKASERRSKWKASTDSSLFLFHLCAFCVFLYAYLWLFGKRASKLRVTGFGRFAQFFSFWCFVAQLTGLMFNVLLHIIPDGKEPPWLPLVADDVSCAVFGHANTVTAMFFLLVLFTTDIASGKGPPPSWLAFVMHVLNSIIAWVDVIAVNRSFRKRAFQLSLMYMFIYGLFLLLCARRNKRYAYAFLNRLPHPEGFFVIAFVVVFLFYFFFYVGSKVNRRSRRIFALRKLKMVDVVK